MKDQILSKNIWELEQRLKDGQGDPRTRLSLLRAYAEQIAETEQALGVPPEERAYLKVCDQSRQGVLLLHGSTGGPSQLRPLGDAFRHGGFSVFGVRMPGHPGGDEALSEHSWKAWLSEAENRYRVLSIWCRQVHVVGLSFGASIALQMNVRPRPRSLVLLAPALHPRLGLLGRLALRLGLHRRDFFRKRLGWKAEVLDGMEAARATDWWKGVPIYAAMCEDDHRIDLSSLSHLRKRSANEKTRIRTFPTGGHVFVETEPKDELRKEILDFLREN